MKIKHPIFECEGVARWYTVIEGVFYYWSIYNHAWVASANEEVQNERRYAKALAENKVFSVRLKGRIMRPF